VSTCVLRCYDQNMNRRSLKALWQQPLVRAALIHVGLLGTGWLIAMMIARALGLSVSLLGILLGYAVINIMLTGWLLRRRVQSEPEIDVTAEALAEFAEEPLGIVMRDAKDRLAKARKRVGRQAAMYQPLDKLVRLTRKIERRLALEPDLRGEFSRTLTDDLPLIADTAEQYVDLAGQDLTAVQNTKMIVAEGVLREAGDRLETLSKSEGRMDAPVIGLIRMDTNAEVLAERLSADTDAATRRATAARVSHALRQAAKTSEIETFSSAAGQIDKMAGTDDVEFAGFLRDHAAEILAKAEAVAEGESGAVEPLQAVLSETNLEIATLVQVAE